MGTRKKQRALLPEVLAQRRAQEEADRVRQRQITLLQDKRRLPGTLSATVKWIDEQIERLRSGGGARP